MIPVLDLKMVRPDLTEGDSTEANIYLAVCKIMFFIDFQSSFFHFSGDSAGLHDSDSLRDSDMIVTTV